MDPKTKEAKRQIELMRARAKQNANRLFNIPDGYSSGMVEELVDDIINCAILEIGVMQAEALQNTQRQPDGCADCSGATGSAPSFDFPKIELLYADRDAYLIYVDDVVNPARAAAKLETISRAVANACYNVVTSAPWRLPKT